MCYVYVLCGKLMLVIANISYNMISLDMYIYN